MWLIFVTFFLLLNSAGTQNIGNCALEGVEEQHWNFEYKNEPKLDSERLEFKTFTISDIQSVSLTGEDYKKYFEHELNLEENYLKIIPTKEFQNYELNEPSTNTERPEIFVSLDFSCSNGFPRSLRFYQPIIDLNTFEPQFEQNVYEFTLPMPLPAQFDIAIFGEDILATDNDITNTILDFAIEPAQHFTVEYGGTVNAMRKTHRALVKTINPLRLHEPQTYTLTVTDTGKPDTKSTSAQLILNINAENTLPPNPSFMDASYTASYTIDAESTHGITLNEPLRLDQNYPASDLSVELAGEYSENFGYTIEEEGAISIILRANLPEGLLEDEPVLILTVKAHIPIADGPAQTAFIVYLPKMECTQEPVTPAPTIKFEQETYSLQISNDQTGFLLLIKASANPEEELTYSLEAIPGVEIPSQIDYNPNTGALSLTESLNIGTYSFIAHAEGTLSHLYTHADVTIHVKEDVEVFRSTYSVLVKHTDEHTAANFEIPCISSEINECKYEIIEQYPSTACALFSVVESNILTTKGVDREMEEIIDLIVPQFTLLLRLHGKPDGMVSNRTSLVDVKRNSDAEVTREWSLIPSPLENLQDHVLVSVIIDDINDNPPIFDAGSKVNIGYPDKDLASLLAPSFLVKVHATDRDVGENAEIAYSVSNENFVIHRKTGVVYVRGGVIEESNLKFTVTATDKDGNDDGLSTDLEIEVRLLSENHLVVLSIKNLLLEEIEETLQSFSEQTNFRIKHLTASTAVIEEASPEEGSTKAVSDLYTKIVVYGFDLSNFPVQNDALQEALKGGVALEGLTIDKWQPPLPSDDNCVNNNNVNDEREDECDTVGLIAAVSVLAALLLIFIIVGGFFYFKLLRGRKSEAYSEMEDDGSSTGSLRTPETTESNLKDVSTRRPTGYAFNPPPVEEEEEKSEKTKFNEVAKSPENLNKESEWSKQVDEDEFGESKVKFRERPTEIISQEIFNKDDEDKDKGKSVTFKETVQKINILVDDTQDEDNSDILSSHL